MSIKPCDLNKNTRIAEQLAARIESGSNVHAYAFTGGSAQDRLQLGSWLAQYLLCEAPDGGPCGECLACRKFLHGNHEDLLRVQKQADRESIVKDQILELIDRLSFKPFGARYVVIIEDAQLMNAASQNKLLKTLEEPVSETVMILLSERTEGLLPTVLSRCCVFCLQDAESAGDGGDLQAAVQFAKLIADGAAFYRKKQIIADIAADKENSRSRADAFLAALEEEILKRLKDAASGNSVSDDAKKRMLSAAGHVETARRYIKQLHSVGYTLKQLCLRV